MPVPSAKKKRARHYLTPEIMASDLARLKQWRIDNPEKSRISSKETAAKWRENNIERARELSRASYANGGIERARVWRKKNPDSGKLAMARYRKLHPEYVTAQQAKKRAQRSQATPQWADKDAIKTVYSIAAVYRKHGFDVHVDHIIPLLGKTVRGFHVHHNLTILPARENLSKGNRSWPEEM